MTKEQATEESKKIFDWNIQEADKIRKAAEANGTWQPGLDSNRELFEELNRKTKEKLAKLVAMIDE